MLAYIMPEYASPAWVAGLLWHAAARGMRPIAMRTNFSQCCTRSPALDTSPSAPQAPLGSYHPPEWCPIAAKNVILAGVQSVTIHDTKTVEIADLGAQFYLSEDDVGRNRAEACKERLQDLNTAVAVNAATCDLTAEFLSNFQVSYRSLRSSDLHNVLCKIYLVDCNSCGQHAPLLFGCRPDR